MLTRMTWLRRHPRLAFFSLGVLTAAAGFWPLVYWLEITRAAVIHTVYDRRPVLLRAAMVALQWLPVVAVVAVVLLRIVRGPVVRAIPFVAGVVAHSAVIAAILFFGPTVDDLWHRQRFDAAAWRRNEQTNVMWPTRLTMVDDLLRRHELRGLTRDSVERLLGPRDNTTSWREWDLVYLLGPERGLIRIDSETLVIRLGPDGRVSDYRVVRD
jgi:hypothetical protein